MPKEKITLEKLAEKMDKRFDKVDKRLAAHDRRFDLIDRKLNDHDRKFDSLDKQVSFLYQKSVDHDSDIKWIKENMATKDDINRISKVLDQQTKILQNLDQERISGTQWLKRLDAEVEKLKSNR